MESSISTLLLDTAKTLIKSAQRVFATLGTGHTEYIYHRAMEIECQQLQLVYETKKILPVIYRGYTIGYEEADIVVHLEQEPDNMIVLEFKAVSYEPREQEIVQVKNYLKSCTDNSLGLLINFPQPSSKSARDHLDVLYVFKDQSSVLSSTSSSTSSTPLEARLNGESNSNISSDEKEDKEVSSGIVI